LTAPARFAAVALIAGAVAAPLNAQRPAILTGRVSEAGSNQPIASAVVRLAGSGRRTLTDATGEFRLADLPSGPVTFYVRAIGYHPIVVDLLLEPGDSVRLDSAVLALRPAPIELPGVAVTSDSIQHEALTLVGFYERRGRGFGAFLEQSELSRWNPHALSDVLRHLPGVRVVSNPNYGHTAPRADFRPYLLELRGCRSIMFFLNGASLGSSSDPQFDIDLLLLPQEISAVEVYRGPSEIPLQYNATNSLCGVVLLWSE
jgi:carboxypeptidase family protein/TonB-dependent receptor-like protein